MTDPVRVLVVADEVSPTLHGPMVKNLAPDLVVSCGDLPFEYLEYLVTLLNVPLVFVPGNHDPMLERERLDALEPTAFSWDGHHGRSPRPRGCRSIDGKVVRVAGLRVAGLGGSIRYSEGPNQYSQRQMTWRALQVEAKCRARRLTKRLDLLVTHAPPEGLGDRDDLPHQGVRAFHRLTRVLEPTFLVHGHVHPYGINQPDRTLGGTRIINVVPFKLLEVVP